jgi:hypothetical protein
VQETVTITCVRDKEYIAGIDIVSLGKYQLIINELSYSLSRTQIKKKRFANSIFANLSIKIMTEI